MMTIQDVLKLTDPKNQNLPKISPDSGFKNYNVVYIPVFEETVKNAEKVFPALKKLKLKGEKKEFHELIENGQLLRVRGMGKKKEMNARKVRRFFGSLYLKSESLKVKKAGLYCEELDWVYFAALGIHVAALNPGLFKPSHKKTSVPEIGLINTVFKAKAAVAKKEIERGMNTAEGKNLMRVLGATPPNSLHTENYAKVIEELCKRWKVSCKNVSKKELEKYELLNAVSLGSKHDSKLLVITIPVAGSKNCTVVVGKGLCYDSGGLQGKGNHMKTMKEDMAGSASVLGTILNIKKNGLKLKETTYFLLPLAENMMGCSAMRADDVWTAGDGQLVEVIHTDAEGRLVMGDAICYAKNNFKNIDSIFTIATLTGSCLYCFADLYTGVVCNDEVLGKAAVNAGKDSGDLVFTGPWDMEYDDNNSPIADVASLGEKDYAGWIKAGLYLARFAPKDKKTGDLTAKFCHFDIAGTIDMGSKGTSYRQKGLNSGVGVGFLSQLLTK